MSELETARPEVVVNLLGENLELCFGLYAMRRLKHITGRIWNRGQIDLEDPDDLVAFLWAGLTQKNKKLDDVFPEKLPSKKVQDILVQLAKELNQGRWNEELMPQVSQALKNAGYKIGKSEEPEFEGKE